MKERLIYQPLPTIDEWDGLLESRYPETLTAPPPGPDPDKRPEEFRDYGAQVRPSVKEFYRLNHAHQTLEFVYSKRLQYVPPRNRKMGIWEAMEFMNTLVDDSDPDTELTQLEHLLQTAEAIREDGHPTWFILTGLIHDLGKLLCLFGERQWAVAGETFPVGCAFSEAIVFPEFFQHNPDSKLPRYQTRLGIYEENTGLKNIEMSWGHDEYLYHVVKDYLPEEALYMIRYHSFYSAHTDGAYDYLMNDKDREFFKWVREFNPYDLYSKSHEPPDVEGLRPFYETLVNQYFPPQLWW